MCTQFLSPTRASFTSPFALQMLISSWLKLTLSPSVHPIAPATVCLDFPIYPSLPRIPVIPGTCCCHFCSSDGEINILFSFHCWRCLLADLQLGCDQSLLKSVRGIPFLHWVWMSLLQTYEASATCPYGKEVKTLTIAPKTKMPGKTVSVLPLTLLGPGSRSAQLPTGKLCIYCAASRITEALL